MFYAVRSPVKILGIEVRVKELDLKIKQKKKQKKEELRS